MIYVGFQEGVCVCMYIDLSSCLCLLQLLRDRFKISKNFWGMIGVMRALEGMTVSALESTGDDDICLPRFACPINVSQVLFSGENQC